MSRSWRFFFSWLFFLRRIFSKNKKKYQEKLLASHFFFHGIFFFKLYFLRKKNKVETYQEKNICSAAKWKSWLAKKKSWPFFLNTIFVVFFLFATNLAFFSQLFLAFLFHQLLLIPSPGASPFFFFFFSKEIQHKSSRTFWKKRLSSIWNWTHKTPTFKKKVAYL